MIKHLFFLLLTQELRFNCFSCDKKKLTKKRFKKMKISNNIEKLKLELKRLENIKKSSIYEEKK